MSAFDLPVEDDDGCEHGTPGCDDCAREEADARRELDDERRAERGTSECDGACDPQCDWCLVGHECPETCGGTEVACPYVPLRRREADPLYAAEGRTQRPRLLLTEANVDDADATWGFNCGPGALCAVLGLAPAVLRPHLGDFESRGYMSPTGMAAALREIGVTYRQTYRGDGPVTRWPPAPDLALVRVQFDGPWTRPEVPKQARYWHTHWIGVHRLPGQSVAEVFDVNALDRGGWLPWNEWAGEVVPLLAVADPKRNGGWWPTHIWEVEGMGGQGT